MKGNAQFMQEVRLRGVSYKMNPKRRICGLQLHFNNKVSSPQIESDINSKTEWKIAELDPFDTIGSVEIYVNTDTGKFAIQALRFRDKNNVNM